MTSLLSISTPALLLAVLVASSAITYILRDWERYVALGAALVTAVITILLFRTDMTALDGGVLNSGSVTESGVAMGAALGRFGFVFRFTPAALPPLVILFAMSTVALALAGRYPQGRSFVPMTLALLGGYSAWFLVAEAPISAPLILPIGVVILSALSAIALQAGKAQRASGPIRWMVAPVLAFPLFMLANYYLQQGPLNPQDEAPLRTAASLLTFGLLLLMAPVPLHSVQPATAESSPPMATGLYLLMYQLAAVYMVSKVVLAFPFMQTLAPLSIWFAWAGLVTAIWAGLAAIGSNHPGRLWGYLSLHDWGLIVLLLSVPGVTTWSLVAFIFVLRVVSMMTAGAGLMAIEHGAGSLDPDEVQGVGVRMPWNTAAYLLGALGLVGFPLSAGFAGHWAALQLVAASDWRPAGAVLVASAAAILSIIRMARTLYGPLMDSAVRREHWAAIIPAVLMIVLSFALALAPQLLNGPVSRAIVSFGAGQ